MKLQTTLPLGQSQKHYFIKQYSDAPKTTFHNLILAKLAEFRHFVPIQNKTHSKNIFENVQNYKFQAAIHKTFSKILSAYEQNCPGGSWQHLSTYILHRGIIPHFCSLQDFSLNIIQKTVGLIHKHPNWTRQKVPYHAIKQNSRGLYNKIEGTWMGFKFLSHRGTLFWVSVARSSLGSSSATFTPFHICQALQVNC